MPKTWQRWTPEEQAQVLDARAAGLSYREIAARLNRTMMSVRGYGQAHSLTPKTPNWSKAEENRLYALLEEHRPYAEIGRLLNRTEGAIRDRCAKLKISARNCNGQSVTAVSRLMGVDQKAVVWWGQQGWLTIHDTGLWQGRGPLRVVEYDDLIAFLENEDHWHHWDPTRITDKGLRAWAIKQRRELTFLSTSEVGKVLYMTDRGVNKLIRQKRIRAVKHQYNWLVRSDWIGPVPWLPRRKGKPVTEAEREFVRQWHGKRDGVWIGKQIGRPSNTVSKIARGLGLSLVGRGYWKRQREATG